MPKPKKSDPKKQKPCEICGSTEYSEYVCPLCVKTKRDCCECAGNNATCFACEEEENRG